MDDTELKRLLSGVQTMACVGVSPDQLRPSFFVARYLHQRGKRVLPVNPGRVGQSLFGEPFRGDLADLAGEPIDMVDIFRRSDEAGAVVDRALEVLDPAHLRAIWMQVGVVDEAAAERARARGLDVVMDRCPKIEHQRLFGELRMAGFNTGIISSKL